MSPSAKNGGIPLIGEFTSGPESRFCPQSTLYHLHRACASTCSTQVLILSLVFAWSLPSSSSIRQLHAFFDLFIQKMIAQVSMSNDKEQSHSSQGIPSSSNQTQSSSTHPNVEQIWAAFAPSSTPQVIWPVRANHPSSTRSNRKISNFPTTVLGLNNQTAKAESSSTCSDESDGDDDSDDELIELIGLYQTRYNAAQKHKVPRSEQKKKFAIIRRFLKGDEKILVKLAY
ncbi:hypothetical protein FRC03_002573 [Tulasnella sp. 419]|nr:hypothetical protein FRC03_002573 [Tulasnella sp. 419]